MITHNEVYAYDISSVKDGILLSGKNTGKGYLKTVCRGTYLGMSGRKLRGLKN